jgi:hypothetical protein
MSQVLSKVNFNTFKQPNRRKRTKKMKACFVSHIAIEKQNIFRLHENDV